MEKGSGRMGMGSGAIGTYSFDGRHRRCSAASLVCPALLTTSMLFHHTCDTRRARGETGKEEKQTTDTEEDEKRQGKRKSNFFLL